MKKVTYTCNLCRQEKPKAHLTAFFFDCGTLPQRYVLNTRVDDCDTHICELCIQVIKTHFKIE